MPAAAPSPARRRRSTDTGDRCEVRCIDAPKVRAARARMPGPATITTLADTFRMLGDPTRLRIVAALAKAELCVCDLALTLGVSSSVVSHSLRALRDMRVVRYRREGKIAYYALDDAHIAALLREGFRHVEEPGAINAGTMLARAEGA
ncbi:MAG: ArsR/SmtB family transcription factor [Gemmatimonadaceae bacterium]